MACPKDGRVLIPAGSYRIKSLFLKSNINIELAEGAVLLARHDRAALAYIPGTVTGDEGAGYAGTDMLPPAAGRARASRPTALPLRV